MKSSVVTWLIHCKNHRLELKVHDAVNHITEATRHFQILIDWLWPQRVQKPAVFLSKCVRVCLLPCLEICRDVGKKSSDTPEVDPSTGKQKVIEAKQFSICLYFGKQGKEIPRFPELDKSSEVLNLFRYIHNYSVNAVLRFIIFTLLWFITVSKIFVCNMHICSKQKGWGNRTFLVVGVGCFLFTCCSFCNETVCWIWVLECSHGLIITISCLKG